jgi:hypothetical protein
MMTAAWIVALFCHAVVISTFLAPSATSDTLSNFTSLIKEEDDVTRQHVGRFSESYCVTCIIAYDSNKNLN